MVNPGISPYSQAYHLRTPEIAPPDATGLGDSWYMDSIFVPEEHVLVRLELGNGSLEGKTKNYSSNSGVLMKAHKIVHGSDKEHVQGEVVRMMDLSAGDVKSIRRNKHNERITLREQYDLTTESLVDILTGKTATRPGKFSRLFRRCFPHLLSH